jgi:hypothetical protein
MASVGADSAISSASFSCHNVISYFPVRFLGAIQAEHNIPICCNTVNYKLQAHIKNSADM